MNGLRLVYNNTRILCVCVYRIWDIPNWRSYRHAASPSWRASSGELHKLLSKPILRVLREKKPLEIFRQFAPSPVHAPLHFRLPWVGWTLPTTTKPLERSRRVYIEGHALYILGTIFAIALTWMGYRYSTVWKVDYTIKDRPVLERVTTSTPTHPHPHNHTHTHPYTSTHTHTHTHTHSQTHTHIPHTHRNWGNFRLWTVHNLRFWV